ncbi:helicase HerA domain-containing protein, partial [Ruthenibacterium lactatiformans]|uniref:helicase HerA domain-containing protein n=1 Tax=Ruthenibacterium lactatiformans TaxID=1550024 RepID=UPI001966F210
FPLYRLFFCPANRVWGHEFISAEIYTLEKELKQDVKLRKKIEKKPELFQKELQRRLLPHSMEFFPSFAVQNGTYRSTMMLKNFPFEIGSCCLLQTACMRGTSFMMRLTPMNGREIKKLTEKQMNKSSYKRSSTQATDQLEGLSEQTALAEFYQAVSNSQTTLFFVSVYIECYGRNEEDLQSTIRAVEEKLITANISAERLIRQQREGFLSVSPLGRDYFLADANNFPSQTVAACYPCSYSSRLDLHGMFLGYTMSGGNFFLDILQRQANVTNSSFCIIGAAGQGKSWLMKKIITFLRMFGVRSFSLDPENEYVDLTKNLNGTIYNCIDGKAKINPLEVRCLRRDDDDEDDKYVSELNNLPIFFQHMSWLKDFFRVLLPGISDKEVTALMILVQEMYKAHGIDGNTDFSVLGPEDYPILSDLYLFIEPMMGKGYKMIEANIIDTLLLYLKSCHDGELSLVFNGHMMREAPLEGTDKLQQQIKEMCDNFKRDPKQYMEYLRFAGQFYQYSIRNRMLIYRQNPYATFVASRTAWNQKEAHILPDQQLKGISILRPITTELIKRENDWVAVRMATNEEREKIAKGELKIYEKTYFAISKVYDISQTDFPKDRYPEIYSMGQKSMDHAEVYACVKELARASGIPVKKEQLPSISLHGYYSPSENAITINSNLEDTKAAVTLCHEYAHGLLHRTSTQSEAICEFEAQSLALMLMARYGLPQDDSEIGYMKTYLERANNDKNFSLDTSLERLQKQLKFVDERISLIAEHRQTEFAQTRAQAREPGKGKQVSENFRVGL